MRCAEDTNLSDCMASTEEDQNTWEEGRAGCPWRKAERNRWILPVTKSKTLHLETKVEAYWFKIMVEEKGPELVYLRTVYLRPYKEQLQP